MKITWGKNMGKNSAYPSNNKNYSSLLRQAREAGYIEDGWSYLCPGDLVRLDRFMRDHYKGELILSDITNRAIGAKFGSKDDYTMFVLKS